MANLAEHEQALLWSQSGPLAGTPFSAAPSNWLTRIEPHLFRVLFLRRLRLPLPLSSRQCRCGRSLDVFGHVRAACSRAGVLGRRRYAVESVASRICCEGGKSGSEETRLFLSLLAKARARSETPVMRRRVEQAWRLRWVAMLAWTVSVRRFPA